MEISERAEATPIQEGIQVTSTTYADYFYFRKGDKLVTVRFPKGPDANGSERTIEVGMSGYATPITVDADN